MTSKASNRNATTGWARTTKRVSVATGSAHTTYTRLASATIVGTYVLIAIGALVRAAGAGLGCPDWPRCFGQWVPPTSADELPAGWDVTLFNPAHTWLEYGNRLIGVLVGFLILSTLVVALRRHRSDRAVLWPSVAAFILVGVQGWLGGQVVAKQLDSGTLSLHLLLALVIVGLLQYAYLSARLVERTGASTDERRPTAPRAVGHWALGVAALLLAQIGLGTVVRSSIQVLADAQPDLARSEWLPVGWWPDLAHRQAAVLVFAAAGLLWLGVRRYLPHHLLLRRWTSIVIVLVGAQLLAGLGLAYLGVPAVLQVLHLSLATLAFGALSVVVFLAYRRPSAVRVARPIQTSRVRRSLQLSAVAARTLTSVVAGRVRMLVTPRHRREQALREIHTRSAERAVATMGAMKGVAMKLGQMVSFLDDLLPPAYTETMRSLQSNALPVLDAEAVLAQVELELGAPCDQRFATFNTVAIAAASIGQVHRATTRDGREVVVKVQYPGVDGAIRADLANASMIGSAIGTMFPSLDAKALAAELRERVQEELDYRIEARNQETFRRMFADDPDLEIPRVITALSSERVLTSEFRAGLGFYEFCERASDEAKQRAGLALYRFVFDAIWLHGAFNADPHPGNFLFREDGRVICLDFGCVKTFPKKFLDDMRSLGLAYLEGRKDDFYEHACRMEFVRSGYEARVGRDWLWDYVRWYYVPILEDAPFTYTPEYTRQATAVVFGDNVRKTNMPPDYLMLNRITFGVNSMLSRLRARQNWHVLAREHFTRTSTEAVGEAGRSTGEGIDHGVANPGSAAAGDGMCGFPHGG